MLEQISDGYPVPNRFVPASRVGGEEIIIGAEMIYPAAAGVTDEEAERRLPPQPIVRRQYHQYRNAGDTPEISLAKTLEVWRQVCGESAYVPHQRHD